MYLLRFLSNFSPASMDGLLVAMLPRCTSCLVNHVVIPIAILGNHLLIELSYNLNFYYNLIQFSECNQKCLGLFGFVRDNSQGTEE